MKKNYYLKSQKGFTIIELMISTIIFSLVLLGATAAIVQIGKQYYKGVTISRTQEVARSTVEEISQSLQYTSRDIKAPNYPGGATEFYGPIIGDLSNGDTFYFCVGVKRYTFALGTPLLAPKNHVFWVDEPNAGCANAVTMGPADLNAINPSLSTYPGVNGRELLDKYMRITEFSVIAKQQQLWTVSLTIATGDLSNQLVSTDPVTGNPKVTCEGSMLGAEFCAVSRISVNVSKRIQ
jgi:prepilin-type N-terminal cleavage/methylation domain-containing protein